MVLVVPITDALIAAALNYIRTSQAKLVNAKSNVEDSAEAEAVRATSNVIQKAVDSCIKTAQEYSEIN